MTKKLTLAAIVAVMSLSAAPSFAGAIDNACLRGGRTSSARLCSCIQRAADLTLSRSDQRRAARFFRDPHEAQKVRASKRSSDNAFWKRYRNFTDTAEAYCR